MRERFASLWARAHERTDGAAVAAFRFLFGALMATSAIRLLAYGWVDRFFVTPTYYFPYWGFEWVRPLPAPWIHVAVGVLALAGACVALGLFYRVASVVAFVLFTYVQLVDVANYLNHYYLVSLVSFLFCFLPLHRVWSLDALRSPRIAAATLPRWITWLLRFQIGTVYVFASLAKATSDWLLHAQPLQIWLAARTDTPLVGPFLDRVEVAYFMSWAGFLYDLTIPIWLSWRRTRPFAYAVLLVFHFFTHVFFEIGMFPLIMSSAALIFFEPSWPRTLARALRLPIAEAPAIVRELVPMTTARRAVAGVLALWCAFHVLMPLRAHAYGGNVLWHEQGMRWSWRVMCREKNGSVTYRVRARGWRHERFVSPSRYLTGDQEREMSAQPDMILRLAHHIAEEHRARGLEDVEVRVDALVSLNGRPMARLVDPDVDLARVEDSILPARWILPDPGGPPIHLSQRALASSGPR